MNIINCNGLIWKTIKILQLPVGLYEGAGVGSFVGFGVDGDTVGCMVGYDVGGKNG